MKEYRATGRLRVGMDLANSGASGSSTGGNALSPTWALSVEERFYLLLGRTLALVLAPCRPVHAGAARSPGSPW